MADRTGMKSEVSHRRSAAPIAALQDFTIQGAAELGECHGAQSFRAVRRSNGERTLLHKFRPAEALIALGPRMGSADSPDFTGPFITRFTDVFVAAGSAYLVEPIPSCFNLDALWRYTLQRRPDLALPVVTVLLRHLLTVVHHLMNQGKSHGALCVENVVLASTGTFGALAAHLECDEGPLWLRRPSESPVESDFHSLAVILGSLLDIESEVADLQNTSALLPAVARHRISELLATIQQTKVYRQQ